MHKNSKIIRPHWLAPNSPHLTYGCTPQSDIPQQNAQESRPHWNQTSQRKSGRRNLNKTSLLPHNRRNTAITQHICTGPNPCHRTRSVDLRGVYLAVGSSWRCRLHRGDRGYKKHTCTAVNKRHKKPWPIQKLMCKWTWRTYLNSELQRDSTCDKNSS